MAVYAKDDPSLLHKALLSIVGQTLQPDELVIVEDGPIPDSIATCIDTFRGQLNIVSLKMPVNQGLAMALNAGLAIATGEVIFRVDSDDFSRPHRFALQSELMKQGYDLCSGAIREVDIHGAPLNVRRIPLTDKEIRAALKRRSPFNHVATAFRRELVTKAGGYPNIYLKEDYALWAKVIASGAKVRNTSEILVDVTAGQDMYKRRGGWRYVKSEFILQKFLLSVRTSNLPEALLFGGMRGSVFLMPSWARGMIYEGLLRTKE
jgi:hypothetical protein